MDERAAFLSAIRARPAEDTPRLMYADWLDGLDAPSDRDRATAQFLRLSCVMTESQTMPRKVYQWLLSKGEDGQVVENWKRLLPSVMAIDAAHCRPGDECIGLRQGRLVSCSVGMPNNPNDASGRPTRPYRMTFEFHRGFVKAAIVYSVHAAGVILEALHHDQPLAELHVVGLTRRRAGDLVERVEQTFGPEAAKRLVERMDANVF